MFYNLFVKSITFALLCNVSSASFPNNENDVPTSKHSVTGDELRLIYEVIVYNTHDTDICETALEVCTHTNNVVNNKFVEKYYVAFFDQSKTPNMINYDNDIHSYLSHSYKSQYYDSETYDVYYIYADIYGGGEYNFYELEGDNIAIFKCSSFRKGGEDSSFAYTKFSTPQNVGFHFDSNIFKEIGNKNIILGSNIESIRFSTDTDEDFSLTVIENSPLKDLRIYNVAAFSQGEGMDLTAATDLRTLVLRGLFDAQVYLRLPKNINILDLSVYESNQFFHNDFLLDMNISRMNVVFNGGSLDLSDVDRLWKILSETANKVSIVIDFFWDELNVDESFPQLHTFNELVGLVPPKDLTKEPDMYYTASDPAEIDCLTCERAYFSDGNNIIFAGTPQDGYNTFKMKTEAYQILKFFSEKCKTSPVKNLILTLS